MGSWGTKLYQSDIALDVRDDYIELLQKGNDDEKITDKILDKYSNELEFEDERYLVILALADMQWKYGRLDDSLKDTALKMIDTISKDITSNNSKYMLSKNEIERLNVKLRSNQPERKKIKIPKTYVCDWKIGDCFAYKLDGEIAKELGYYGRYLIIIKVGTEKWYPEHIIPKVWLKITSDSKIPSSLKEIDEAEFIQVSSYFYESRFFYSDLEQYEELKNKRFETDEYGYLPRYRFDLVTTSKRIIPKKLIYLGNYLNVMSPKNEFIAHRSYISVLWKKLEEFALRNYFDYNKRHMKIYSEEYITQQLKFDRQESQKDSDFYIKNYFLNK